MKNSWDARIRRATELGSIYPFAAEALHFYAQVAMLQQKLYLQLERGPAQLFSPAGTSWDQLNLSALLPGFQDFLTNVKQIAPARLAQSAGDLLQADSAEGVSLLADFWSAPEAIGDEREERSPNLAARHMAWLFLQPCAEYLAGRQGQIQSDGSARKCPFCGGRPIVGVLRPEGDGARKSLICMLCAHEWPFRRLYCPSCGEEGEPRLAFYSAPEIPHVRVDVCDSCHTYLKSVDLTKTGLAVPIVDELAALPLDLWARENGYQKLQTNTVGM